MVLLRKKDCGVQGKLHQVLKFVQHKQKVKFTPKSFCKKQKEKQKLMLNKLNKKKTIIINFSLIQTDVKFWQLMCFFMAGMFNGKITKNKQILSIHRNLSYLELRPSISSACSANDDSKSKYEP